MEWETTRKDLDQHKKAIAEGKPVGIPVFDHATYERLIVTAIIYAPNAAATDKETLWIKDASDWIEPEPWGIKIIEKSQEDFTKYAKSEHEARLWHG